MSRVTEFRLPMTVVFAGSALIGLGLCAGLATAGVELGLNLTIVGLVLALLLPLGLEVRNRASRVRRVVILDYRAHQFGHAVARGAMRTLSADRRRWSVEYKAPTTSTGDGSLAWQIRELQTAVIEDLDGIILIPSDDDRDLWFALAAAIKTKIFAVAIDTKPPNTVFRNTGIEPPRFVSARYGESGEIIGKVLTEWLSADPLRQCVLWTGPDGSFAGEERSRNILYRLAQADLLDRTVLMPMDDWAPDSGRCRDTLKIVESSPTQVAVYAGDDENAMALHWLTVSEHAELRHRMFLIGCNATPDDWGHVPALDLRTVEATVDILAEEQGVQAALLFVKERSGKLPASQRSVYISPELARPADAGSTWLHSLFAAEGNHEDEVTEVETITQDEEGKLSRATLEEVLED